MLETSRLDTVVEHVFDTLCSQYEVGEYINCLWDDGIAYVDIFFQKGIWYFAKVD